MRAHEFKHARRKRGWSQQELANRLSVSQSYVAMLENGQRQLTPSLVRQLARLFHLPPTVLPPSGSLERESGRSTAQGLAEQLAALGYPGLAYLRSRSWKRNPAEVLLAALAQPDLEARVVEALPWLLVSYPDMDTNWLVREAKLRDLQNRLGFVVTLARELAERKFPDRAGVLRRLEQVLEQSRLAKEDSLCKAAMPTAEQRWLRANRSPQAAHWNLLTDWRTAGLRYDA